jgi:DNA-directed RNA polymerase specialized sigma24 family protein
VKQVIGNLLPDDCRLFEMRFLHRMRYDEISGRLQTNAPRLRKRIHRTLGRIRKALPVLRRMQRQLLLHPQKQVICLRYCYGYSANRIARQLHLEEDAVARWLQHFERSGPPSGAPAAYLVAPPRRGLPRDAYDPTEGEEVYADRVG